MKILCNCILLLALASVVLGQQAGRPRKVPTKPAGACNERDFIQADDTHIASLCRNGAWVDIPLSPAGGIAPADATYITQTPNGTLTSEQALSLLATGIPKVTTGSGIVSISNVTDDAQTKAAIVPNTAPAAGQILCGNAGGTAYAPCTVGTDATLTSAGALTLASVITAGGPTGSATVAPIITYDAKGRLTTVSSATITPAVGSVTGLGTGVATALGVNVGSAGAFVTFNGAGGTPSSMVGTNITGTASGLTAGAVTGFIAGPGVLTGPASAGVAETLGNNETITGIKTFSPTARSSGAAAYLTLNIPSDTAQTASTESPGFKTVTATRQWASTGTVALQRENFFAGPTYSSASASQTFTDAFTLYATPPVAGTNAIFTRGHTLGIVDSTSAASSITGAVVIATTLGTTATSVGIGGGNVSLGAKIPTYNNVATAGWGVPAIYGSGRSTAQTGAVASVATYTVGAADGSFEVSANVLVTTSTTHNFTVTCAYTDEGSTARTITFTFSNVGGTLATAIINTGGAVPYEGVPLHIRAKASTAITIATAGTFTSVTYNVEGIIKQMS